MKAAMMFAAVVLASACSSSPPAGGSGDDGTGPGTDPASGTLTEFVTNMIVHQTVDDQPAVTFEVFATLPDSDGDSNNPAAYAGLF